MKRLLYFGYYIKKIDVRLYKKFISFASKETQKSKLNLLFDSIISVFIYNVSLLEYFQFRFYRMDKAERKKYAGTGYMYEYQLLMNPKEFRNNLEDKRIFLKKFKPFINHSFIELNVLKEDTSRRNILENSSGKVVLKSHNGQCGIGVEVRNTDEFNYKSLIKHLESTDNNLVEEFIVQHPDIMELSPSGLNTIRIFTQLNYKNEVEILGCRLRISINSIVDNMAAGNIAATINEKTGIVEGPGVYSDIVKQDEIKHPITNVQIKGFQVPFWNETMDMIRDAALFYPECRSIGWDVAITKDGPELIEANHDWCKLVWQLPVKKGLREILENHKNQYLNSK